MRHKKAFLIGITLAIIIASLDLWSKIAIFNMLDNLNSYPPAIKITSFFSIVKVWNTGVSFGMFNNLANGKIIILTINLAILLVLLIWLYRNKVLYLSIALGLIIGGAAGNIIDRIINNAVADFLDFYIGNYHWPAFNLADSTIFIGVALLLLENYFVKKPDEK